MGCFIKKTLWEEKPSEAVEIIIFIFGELCFAYQIQAFFVCTFRIFNGFYYPLKELNFYGTLGQPVLTSNSYRQRHGSPHSLQSTSYPLTPPFQILMPDAKSLGGLGWLEAISKIIKDLKTSPVSWHFRSSFKKPLIWRNWWRKGLIFF